MTKIVVRKSARVLELWDGPVLAARFPVGLGPSPEGRKQQAGDGKTPEGEYYVCTRNDHSRYYLSLGVSYPNKLDAGAARDSGLIDQLTHDAIVRAIDERRRPPWGTKLGGEIMIHGHGGAGDWTAGCVAVDDDVMDILWQTCPIGTAVELRP